MLDVIWVHFISHTRDVFGNSITLETHRRKLTVSGYATRLLLAKLVSVHLKFGGRIAPQMRVMHG